MNEAIYGRERHGLVGEDFSPFAKGLVCGDELKWPPILGPVA